MIDLAELAEKVVWRIAGPGDYLAKWFCKHVLPLKQSNPLLYFVILLCICNNPSDWIFRVKQILINEGLFE